MKLHRFYVPEDSEELSHDFWLHNEELLHQWNKVLRFRAGQKLVLFDGIQRDRLYNLEEITTKEAHLVQVTDLDRKTPKRNVYLLWTLLKKDKNDWVLQKCTELGVSHFVPIIAERSEMTGFNADRAQKIVIEAAEQCGRSDIPNVREPMRLETALNELNDKIQLYVCEQGEEDLKEVADDSGVLIGPEGGWSDDEKELFEMKKLKLLNLHDFTLRAETACVIAVNRLMV